MITLSSASQSGGSRATALGSIGQYPLRGGRQQRYPQDLPAAFGKATYLTLIPCSAGFWVCVCVEPWGHYCRVPQASQCVQNAITIHSWVVFAKPEVGLSSIFNTLQGLGSLRGGSFSRAASVILSLGKSVANSDVGRALSPCRRG